MKKVVFIWLVSLLLASCGSSDVSDTNLSAYEWNGFTIQVPKAWVKIDAKAAPTPGNGVLESAWSSTEIASGFANNLVILSEKLDRAITSKKYSIINYALSTGKYTDFIKLDEKTITFSSESGEKDESNLYTFEAKYNPETPKRKFLQTAKVCGDRVYLMTIGINLGITDVKKYESLLTSFQCTERKNEK